MNILGIETATPRLSAALITTDGCIRERHTDSRSSHCELLTSFIIELTGEAGIDLKEINSISVSIVPAALPASESGSARPWGLHTGLVLTRYPSIL